MSASRLHGYDALRAVAMILGIVLHALIPYKVVPVNGWPVDNSFHHTIIDFIYFAIHAFRMELFFFIAGYFAHLVLVKKGEAGFISNRAQRIFLPLVVSIIVLLPLSVMPFKYYELWMAHPDWQPSQLLTVSFKQILRWNGLLHLWFLYYLLIFYAGALLLRRLVRSLPAAWYARLLPLLHYTNPWFVIRIALPVGLLLFFQQKLPLETSTSIFPPIAFLLYYGIYFWVGYVNFDADRSVAPRTQKRSGIVMMSIVCLVLIVAAFLAIQPDMLNTIEVPKALQATLLAFASATIVRTCLISFNTLFTGASRTFRYIADASYWLYLSHLLFVAWMEVLLICRFPGVYPPLKFPIVLTVALGLSLLSYEYCVRYTFIGKYLHGEKKRNQPRQ